ncbi:MAG TPA: MogA/MoaB family molybdenum cofactor biosynthesis protein [Bacteroidales bacterium]
MNVPENIEILIITLSDRAYRGEYEDLSGPRISELVQEYFEPLKMKCTVTEVIIPDEAEELSNILSVSGSTFNIIFTTGGTGIGPRDITVEVIKPLLTKEIPGIMEFIRIKYGTDKPNALLSRGVAGLIGNTLIYTLPGSVRAVTEYMEEILKTLEHTIYMQYGIDAHEKH